MKEVRTQVAHSKRRAQNSKLKERRREEGAAKLKRISLVLVFTSQVPVLKFGEPLDWDPLRLGLQPVDFAQQLCEGALEAVVDERQVEVVPILVLHLPALLNRGQQLVVLKDREICVKMQSIFSSKRTQASKCIPYK